MSVWHFVLTQMLVLGFDACSKTVPWCRTVDY